MIANIPKAKGGIARDTAAYQATLTACGARFYAMIAAASKNPNSAESRGKNGALGIRHLLVDLGESVYREYFKTGADPAAQLLCVPDTR
ncbi:MAG: hypothetical protein ACREDR_21565 [Blastocatellia bacterium]